MNMAEALARNAQRFPEKLAIVDGRRKLSHRDFHLRSNRLGNYLLGQGVRKGDRVALSCGNRAEHLEFIFALAKIGAISIPFDYGWSLQEYDAMIKFFEPSAFLIEDRSETRSVWELVQDRLDAKRILAVDAVSVARTTLYEQAIASAPSDDPPVDIDGKDPFLVMITSGTTGFPKGCVIDHETYALRSLNNAISKGLNDRERGLLTLPLHFNAGRGSAMSLLYLGATLFLLDKFADDTFVDILEREQITYTILVPALCQRLLRHPKLASIDKSSLNYVGITGGHLTPTLAQAVTEKLSPHVYEAYASTDCGQIAILEPADRAAHSDTVGRTIWAVLIKILRRRLPRSSRGRARRNLPAQSDGDPRILLQPGSHRRVFSRRLVPYRRHRLSRQRRLHARHRTQKEYDQERWHQHLPRRDRGSVIRLSWLGRRGGDCVPAS